MSILAGIGTAGVPGGSLPLIVLVLQSVGVPGEGIGVILGVDRLLDMCRTTVNVTGDVAAAAYVARSEGFELDTVIEPGEGAEGGPPEPEARGGGPGGAPRAGELLEQRRQEDREGVGQARDEEHGGEAEPEPAAQQGLPVARHPAIMTEAGGAGDDKEVRAAGRVLR